MLIVGLDLETTGLDVGTAEILEVGAVLWDCEAGRPLRFLSEITQIEGDLPTEITELTGIRPDDVQRFGCPLEKVLEQLHDFSIPASHIVAHNGLEFDRLFLEKAWLKMPTSRIQLPWIDTTIDVPYSSGIGTRKLSYLAAEHGFLNPFAHRALFDVLTMLHILKNYSMEDILAIQASPVCKVIAQVSYENRGDAKANGFRWDPQQRHWFIQGKEKMLKDREFPFPVLWV